MKKTLFLFLLALVTLCITAQTNRFRDSTVFFNSVNIATNGKVFKYKTGAIPGYVLTAMDTTGTSEWAPPTGGCSCDSLELYKENPSSAISPVATGINSIAIGSGYSAFNLEPPKATGAFSFSIGSNQVSEGVGSISIGISDTIKGTASTAIGAKNFIDEFSNSTYVIGDTNNVNQCTNCFVSGNMNVIDNSDQKYSVVIGNANTSSVSLSNKNQIILGDSNRAFFHSSTLIGRGLETVNPNSTLIGTYNDSIGRNDPKFVVGIGNNNSSKKNGLVIYSFGGMSIAVADSFTIYAISPPSGTIIFCSDCSGNGITGRILAFIDAAWRRLSFE